MFGFFKKKEECPVPDAEKKWIEDGLLWFRSKLGNEYFLEQKILLQSKLFDQPYHAKERDAHELTNKLCLYLELDPSEVQLSFFDENTIEFTEGLVTKAEGVIPSVLLDTGMREAIKYTILVNKSKMNNPEVLAGTLAYYLLIIKCDTTFTDVKLSGHMIELSSVIFGLGITLSNSIISSHKWQGNRYSGWSIQKRGYLSQQMMAYALALTTRYSKNQTQWSEELCNDVKAHFKRGLNYIDQLVITDKPAFLSESIKSEAPINPPSYYYIINEFYSNRFLRSSQEMKDGYKEGMTVFYHSNQNLWAELEYRNGIPWTVHSNYDRSGTAREKGTLTNGTGTLFSYDEEDNLLFIQHYENGRPVKIERFNEG